MFGSLDRVILMGERVDMARYAVIDPRHPDVSDVDLARMQGWNDLLRWLRQDSFCDVAELIGAP